MQPASQALLNHAGIHVLLDILLNVHKELSDLMCIHTRCWHLNGTCPIEVVMTQIVSQFFQACLCDTGGIECHIEMGRQDTALSAFLWHQKEVISGVIILILDYSLVNDGA